MMCPVQNDGLARFKSPTLFQETESNKAAMRVLGEQMARKAERDIAKELFENEGSQPEKSLGECLQVLSPIASSSRLLSPTKAYLNSAYQKSEPDEGMVIHGVAPLAPSSHLLMPTSSTKQRSPHSHSLSVESPPTTPAPLKIARVSDRLTAFTNARKCAAYKKPVMEVDPREEGWDTLFNAQASVDILASLSLDDQCSPHRKGALPASTGARYQHVQSRLFRPTAASKHSRWAPSHPSTPCKAIPGSPPSSNSTHHSQAIGPYRFVKSRLHRPTAASESCKYRKNDHSALATPCSSCSPAIQRSRSISVSSRSTSAQKSGQRSKYVPVEDKADIALRSRERTRPSSAPPGRARDRTKDGVAGHGGGTVTRPTRVITQIRREINGIVDCMKCGQAYDARHLEALMVELHTHPLYAKQKSQRCEAWRVRFMPRAEACLEEERGFLPPYWSDTEVVQSFVDGMGMERLIQDGLYPELAERVLTHRCLWLLHMDPMEFMRLSADTLQEFSTNMSELDIVELFALYAVISRIVDASRDAVCVEIVKWRGDLERELKKLLAQEHDCTLPSHRARCPMYSRQKPVYAPDREGGVDDRQMVSL